MPVGAYGGRRDLMALIAPEGPVYQAGTLSGHPLTMAAGIATLALLDDAAYEQLEATGAELEAGLRAAAAEAGRTVAIARVGSLLTVFFRDGDPDLDRRGDGLRSGRLRPVLRGDARRRASSCRRPSSRPGSSPWPTIASSSTRPSRRHGRRSGHDRRPRAPRRPGRARPWPSPTRARIATSAPRSRLPVDVTPVWFMRQAGRSLPEFRAIRERASLVEITRDPALCAEVTLQPVRRLGVDAAILFADITTPFTGLGVSFEITPGVGPVIERPIASASDVERLRPFEPAEAVGPLLEAIRLIRAESPVPLIGFAGAPFTLACYLIDGGPSREFPRTRAFMHARAGRLGRAHGPPRRCDRRLPRARRSRPAPRRSRSSTPGSAGSRRSTIAAPSCPGCAGSGTGIEGLGVPSTHFGVGTAGLLRLQAEAGGDVIGLDWRIALDDGWALVGDRAVQGNLDPTLLLGPWRDVEDAARWILDLAGGRPGHVFNLGHGVLPETDRGRPAPPRGPRPRLPGRARLR